MTTLVAASNRKCWFFAFPIFILPVLILSACDQEKLKQQADAFEQQKQLTDVLKRERDTAISERDAAIKERDQFRARVEELSNTPAVLLSKVEAAVTDGKREEAQQALNEIKTKYPRAPETTVAQNKVSTLVAKIEAQLAETRRIEAMGFKALKTSTVINTGWVKVTVDSPRISKQFIFDHYDSSYSYRYHYRDADRDHKYVSVGLSATAAKGESDPNLPSFALYYADGKELRRINHFDIQFSRWESYATFLGTYSDSHNDFAKTATIRFSMGVQVHDDMLKKKPLFIVATKKGCEARSYERFRNPPIYYRSTCHDLLYTLTLESFTKENSDVTLVRRID
jgi:hypothetical protein